MSLTISSVNLLLFKYVDEFHIYYLTINQETDKERSNTARKRVDSTDIIDLRIYKQQKKELAESQSEMQELGSELQSD